TVWSSTLSSIVIITHSSLVVKDKMAMFIYFTKAKREVDN
ncbi:unnamed protein product, partial [marine sediment metagenome]